ncbi:MAG: hypothetical protein NC210_03210 [[Clostridium] fimetarium]|nr:hypothetical protein [Alistipes timonensis]MCM1405411.1 hypothetical protein [[Clostridium] fimetarium]
MALAVWALAAAAQNAESPKPMVMGSNSCATSQFATVYFSYTAPEDQLVTLDGLPSITVTRDGQTVPAASNSTTKISRFAVEGGGEYVMSVFSTSDLVEFSASATPYAYTSGTTCGNPVITTDGENFIPFYSEGSGMFGTTVPIYMLYAADETGRLEMTFDGTVSSMAYAESCDGEFTPINNGEYAGTGWMASIQVEAGHQYIVRGQARTAMMADFELVLPNPGASCADPWTARRGKNEIPAAAGSYWYGITFPAAPANGFVVLESDSKLPGGGITLKSSCTSSYDDIKQEGEIALRVATRANVYRVLNIVKAADTPEPESFTLTFQDLQTYDSFETAEPLEPGVAMTTPAFGGTYYYAIEAPAKGAYFLDLVAEAEVAEGTRVSLYDQEKDFLSLASGTDKLHYEVTPGTTYVIEWVCPDATRSLPFVVSFNPVKQGETEANPLEAVLGDNVMPESAAVYFTYTAADDSWLVVTPSDESLMPRVTTIGANGFKTAVDTYPTDNGKAVKFEAVNGTEYMLAFTNVGADASFALSQQAYAAGETPANPIIVEGTFVNIPDSAGKTWYAYSPSENGILELTTTLEYSYSNSIYVYINEVNDANRQTMSSESYGSSNYAMMSLTVTADDVVYVCVNTSDPKAGATFSFNMRQPEPGETPANPIVIDFATNPMNYTFDKTVGYGDSPVWYSIELSQDIFDMTSEGSFGMSMYAAGDTENEIARSAGSMFGPNYIKNVFISAPGTYLLKLTSASAAFEVTFSERAAGEGETPANAILIQPNEVPYNITFPVVNYGEMPVWYAIDLVAGDFNIVQSQSATASCFKEGDYVNSVARLSYNYGSDNYSLVYDVLEPGRYFYRIDSSYTEGEATLSGSAIRVVSSVDSAVAEGGSLAVAVVAGGIEVATSGVVRVYTVDGRLAATREADGGVCRVSLYSGVYVVVANGDVTKVVVR